MIIERGKVSAHLGSVTWVCRGCSFYAREAIPELADAPSSLPIEITWHGVGKNSLCGHLTNWRKSCIISNV